MQQYYKTLNSRFNLPNLVNSGKVNYHNLDTSVFLRTYSKDGDQNKKTRKITISDYEGKTYSRNSQDINTINSINSLKQVLLNRILKKILII